MSFDTDSISKIKVNTFYLSFPDDNFLYAETANKNSCPS